MRVRANGNYRSIIQYAGMNYPVVLEAGREYELDPGVVEGIERDAPGIVSRVKGPANDRMIKAPAESRSVDVDESVDRKAKLEAKTNAELREMLAGMDLPISGVKEELVARILESEVG